MFVSEIFTETTSKTAQENFPTRAHRRHFSLFLIGACSSTGTSREINFISQCDKFNIVPPAWKPKNHIVTWYK